MVYMCKNKQTKKINCSKTKQNKRMNANRAHKFILRIVNKASCFGTKELFLPDVLLALGKKLHLLSSTFLITSICSSLHSGLFFLALEKNSLTRCSSWSIASVKNKQCNVLIRYWDTFAFLLTCYCVSVTFLNSDLITVAFPTFL